MTLVDNNYITLLIIYVYAQYRIIEVYLLSFSQDHT